MGLERVLSISEDHPSLAGHFPGHPVVPGVVILGEVMNVIRQSAQGTIEFVGLPAAKFMSPLSPGEALTIRLDQQGNGATEFTCKTGTRLIASGCLRYRIVADDFAGDL